MRTGAFLTIAMALGVAAAPALSMTVKGDRAAWGDVAAAYKKLNSLSGYRMTMAMPNGMRSTVDMIPRDTMRMVSQMPGGRGSMEILRIGNRSATRMKMPGVPSTWQCRPLAAVPALPPDPASLQGTVDISRGPDTQIAGTPVHTYIYTLTMPAMQRPTKTTLSVNTKTGLPLQTVVAVGGNSTMTTDYSDYGAKFDIRLPAACG